jgi:hypothetical protein
MNIFKSKEVASLSPAIRKVILPIDKFLIVDNQVLFLRLVQFQLLPLHFFIILHSPQLQSYALDPSVPQLDTFALELNDFLTIQRRVFDREM